LTESIIRLHHVKLLMSGCYRAKREDEATKKKNKDRLKQSHRKSNSVKRRKLLKQKQKEKFRHSNRK